MHLLYLDEAGSPRDVHFVLAGVVVEDTIWKKMNDELNSLKEEYFDDKSIDLKGLRRHRHENISKGHPNPFYDKEEEFITEFGEKLDSIICANDLVYLASIIHKEKHRKKYFDAEHPYSLSYIFLLERFQYILNDNKSLGIVFLEYSSKSLQEKLDVTHHHYQSEGTDYTKIERVIEGCHTLLGIKSNFTQIADLFCASVFAKYEYGNDQFLKKFDPYIYKKSRGRKKGYGLKYFPKEGSEA